MGRVGNEGPRPVKGGGEPVALITGRDRPDGRSQFHFARHDEVHGRAFHEGRVTITVEAGGARRPPFPALRAALENEVQDQDDYDRQDDNRGRSDRQDVFNL